MSDSKITMVQLTPQEEAAEAFTEARRILADRERATLEALAEADALKIAADSLAGQLKEMGDTLSPLYMLAHSRPDLFPAKVGESLLPVIVREFLAAFHKGYNTPGMTPQVSRQTLEARILELEGVLARQLERHDKSEKAKKDLIGMVNALRDDLASEKKAMAEIHEAGGVEEFRQLVAGAARAPLLARIAALESENTSMRDATASAKRALEVVCPF